MRAPEALHHQIQRIWRCGSARRAAGSQPQSIVRDNVPGELRLEANSLHDSRDALYAIASRLPRTLCHLDFWSKDLFADARGMVLIDWSFVGDGALGEDIANLALEQYSTISFRRRSSSSSTLWCSTRTCGWAQDALALAEQLRI